MSLFFMSFEHRGYDSFESAIQNLRKGKELTGKILSDLESKRKWLAIAELFLAEIKEQEQTAL